MGESTGYENSTVETFRPSLRIAETENMVTVQYFKFYE
jgi:hypothetical protein